MKKTILFLMTAFLLLLFIPTHLKANEETGKVLTTATITAESANSNALIVRLNEIKAMDIPALSSTEKKELRKEVRTIKKRLKAINKGDAKSPAVSNSETIDNGGVYLSAGAVIIIILLLILLL